MSLAYSVGRIVGANKTLFVVLAIVATLILISMVTSPPLSPVSPPAAKRVDAARALAERCLHNFTPLLAEAEALMKEGNSNGAFNVLHDCKDQPSDPRWAALYDKSFELSKVEDAKIAKTAAADLVKREAAEKAGKKREGVRIGMSQQDVLDSKWGRPQSVNRTTNAFGTREQWVYGGGNYLYFSNGVLESIQN